MAEIKTKNGVTFQFDNNIIEGLEEGDKPLVEFDSEGNLTGIHIVGYKISKIKDK